MLWIRNRPKLVFIHVPKTGGSSVSRSLERAYRFSRFHVNAGVSWRAAGKMTDAAPGSPQHEKVLQTLRSGLMVHAAESGTRFLTGHVWYTPAIRRLMQEGYRVMTCLRNPVDRLLSNYLYNRFNEGSHVATGDDIDAFLASERATQMATVYVKYLSGGRDDDDYTSAPAVADALKAMEGMDVVGVLEDMDDFLRRAGDLIGVGLKNIHRRRSPALGREEYKVTESAEIRKRAEELCRADMEVYAHAERLARRPVTPRILK